MKKLLLGLATLSLIGASTGLGVVVSLSKVSIITMKGFLNTGSVTIDDMKTTIAAIKVYERSSGAGGDKDTLITALNATSFIDLAVVDTPNFVITYNETAGNESVILTAKDGFTFGAGKVLTSVIRDENDDILIAGSLNTKVTTIVEIETTIAAIKVYKRSSGAGSDKDTLITALNATSFIGLEKEYLDKFDITYNENAWSKSIILTTKDGFTFGAGKVLTSIFDSSVTIPGSINSGPTSITNIRHLIAAVKTYQGITNPTDAQKTRFTNDLNYKVFTGLEKANLDGFIITYNENARNESIILTTKGGFTFGAGKVLLSQYDEIVPYSGETLNKSDLAGIGWDSLTTITLQDWKDFAPSVKQLGTSINDQNITTTAPFYKNAVLKSIEIPNTIEIIGSYAFAESTIETITFQSESILTTISMDVFLGCTDFKSDFTLPDSVTHIYKEAFRRANFNGKQLIINPSSSSLTTLDVGIFGEAVNIANMIHIPSSVANILSNSFIQTTNLTNGFSIEAKWRTGDTAMYGFNKAQWDTKITWR